ncbi:MAG: PepSY domain-containing protein [Elusimicrobia bacterium]|nr:PepSY domain-containing protein [Elusimicrobiota bacterium]
MKHIPLTFAMALTFAVSPAMAETAPKIGQDQATKTVLAAVPGARVESAEHEQEDGHDIWSFDLKTKEGLREVWVDAQTGAVIQNVLETPAEQGKEKILDKAEEVVKKRISGEVIDSKQSKLGKRRVSEVTIKAKDGRVLLVTVDAGNDKILKIRPVRSKKDEAKERGENGEKGEAGEKGEHGEQGEHD